MKNETGNELYANSSQNDAYTLNINYIYQYSGTAIVKDNMLGWGESALTPNARDAFLNSPTEFRSLCGNSYVSQMDATVSVLMKISLKFNSIVEKNSFDAAFKDIGGLNNVLAQIKNNPKNIDYVITASGIQLGGDANLFNQLFAKYGGSIGSGDYATLYCGVNGGISNDCTNLINDTIDYARGVKEQLKTLDNYYYSNPIVSNWPSIGIAINFATDDPKILNAMQQITTQYYKDVDNLKLIENYFQLMQSKSLLSATMEQNMRTLQTQYTSVVALYKDPAYHVLDCYNGVVSNRCIDIKQNIFTVRNNILNDGNLNNLLGYLRNNQYMINLNIDPNNRQYSNCLLSPISMPNDNLFLVNCDGQISGTLDSNDGIHVTKGKYNLTISNLNYFYTLNHLPTKFTYKFNTPLMVIEDNAYYANASVTAGTNNFMDSTQVSLFY